MLMDVLARGCERGPGSGVVMVHQLSEVLTQGSLAEKGPARGLLGSTS